KVMQGGKTSVISIAAAEAQRRAQKGRTDTPLEELPPLKERVTTFIKQFSMIAAGIIVVGIAIGTVTYLVLRPTTTPVQLAPNAPFIAIDQAKPIVLGPGES